MVRLGIVGPGRIVERVMPDMVNSSEIKITAVASRSYERAEAAARKYNIPHAYGSYEEMAASDQVDLVYIALPHPFHCEAACLMMQHGKNVICEKPMTVNDAEAEKMIRCARENNVFLMEAMWTRFVPATLKAKELVAAGAIGEIRHMYADFAFRGAYDEKDRVYALDLAGGALLDLGVYPLMAMTDFMGCQPVKASALAHKAPTGADMRMSVQMLFENGVTGQFFCGMDVTGEQSMLLYGTEGIIEIPHFWEAESVILRRSGCEEEIYRYPHQFENYHYEFDHAAKCIQQGLKESPVVTLAESLAVSKLCTELRKETGILYPMD